MRPDIAQRLRAIADELLATGDATDQLIADILILVLDAAPLDLLDVVYRNLGDIQEYINLYEAEQRRRLRDS